MTDESDEQADKFLASALRHTAEASAALLQMTGEPPKRAVAMLAVLHLGKASQAAQQLLARLEDLAS